MFLLATSQACMCTEVCSHRCNILSSYMKATLIKSTAFTQAKHLEMHSHWSQNLKAATGGFHLLYVPFNYRKKKSKKLENRYSYEGRHENRPILYCLFINSLEHDLKYSRYHSNQKLQTHHIILLFLKFYIRIPTRNF